MTVRVIYDNIQVGFVLGARSLYGVARSGYSGITNEEVGTYNIRYGNKVLYTQQVAPHGRVDVVISPEGVTLNGELVSESTYGSDFAPINCFLFTINNSGTPIFGEFGVNRIRRFTIKNVIDLIPVRKGVIGYMYDKISGEFFGNSGTGEFIIGPDIG